MAAGRGFERLLDEELRANPSATRPGRRIEHAFCPQPSPTVAVRCLPPDPTGAIQGEDREGGRTFSGRGVR